MDFLYSFTKPTNPFQDFRNAKSNLSYVGSLYNSIYRFHQKLSPCPLVWDSNSELFVRSNQRKTPFYLSVWTFNIFIVIGVIKIGSCIHVALNYNSPDVSKSLLVMSMGLGTTASLCVGGAWVISKHVEVTTAGLKVYQSLHLKSHEARRQMRVTTDKPLVIHKPWYWEVLSLGLSIIICDMASIPFILVPGVFYLEIDPFHFTIPQIIPANFICGSNTPDPLCLKTYFIVVNFFRILFSTICVVEACRFLSFYYFIMIHVLEFLHKSAEIIGSMLPSGYFNNGKEIANHYYKYLKWYTCLVLAPQIIDEAMSLIVAVSMGVGFVIFVICNLATIRCFNILPLEVYWFMPAVSGLCAFLVYFMLQLTVEADIYSQKITDQIRKKYAFDYRSSMLSLDRKICERKLNNLCPIKIKCGSFYVIRKGAEMDYYYHVFVRTVDLVLFPIWQK